MGFNPLRAAEAQDWVKRVINGVGRYPTRLQRVSISAVSEVGDLEIPISAPLTTLCGPNGVGKSIVLKSIHSAIEPESARYSPHSGIPSGNVEVSGFVKDNEFQVSRRQSDVRIAGDRPSISLTDCGSFASKISEILSKVSDFTDILEDVDALELTGEDLDDVRYVACKDYRFVRVYEVDVGMPAPFFEVGYGDDQYDSRNMGMGELCGLAFWWHLRRSEHETMLLIEEPEAYLSALAQEHLSHVLSKYLIRRRLSAVVSTHSEAFMRVTHRDSLILLVREGREGVRAHRRPHRTMLKALGIEHKLKAIVYVEDEAAFVFAKTILRELDPELGYSVEFHPMGGDGDLASALRLNRALRSQIKFIGAFDGDLSGNIPADVADVSVLLPGAEPVEAMFRAIVLQDRIAACARLGHAEARQILASLDGLDHHDWLTNLAQALETEVSEVIKRLFPLWLEADGNRHAGEKLCSDLRAFDL